LFQRPFSCLDEQRARNWNRYRLRPTSRLGLYAAIGISLIYAVIGTLLVPRLWADPLGPMLKIWPIIVMHFVALAILDDR
jgi:DoxX-like family